VGHRVSCGLWPLFSVRYVAKRRWFQSFDAHSALATYRESLLSGADIDGLVFWMASWTSFSTQVDALGLDSSHAAIGVLVSGWTGRQSLGIAVNTARIGAREIGLLLWLGLSATRPMHRPIAPDDALLFLCRVFFRSVGGPKYVREDTRHF
jgi:hypothetical protein